MKLNRYDNEKEKINIKEETNNQEKEEDEDEENYSYNEDNHNKKMINGREHTREKENIQLLKNKIFYYKIFSVTLVILTILIILIIFLKPSKRENKEINNSLNFNMKNKIISLGNNQTNEGNENTNQNIEDNIDTLKFNRIKEELNNIYNNNGEINIIKFYEEKINQNTYSLRDISDFNNIHINIGFNEKDIDSVIIHISSILYNSIKTTFLHIHMMGADTFTYESLVKLKNMIYKINNNTEIIVYNASQALKDFKIREDSLSKFSKEYAKLYAFKKLSNIQKIIFLDADDCIVKKDLFDLYNLDMNDIYGRGISEIPSIKHQMDWFDNYLYDKSHYINGGVILINLELCQKDDFYNKAIELNNNEFYLKTEEPAQDILNVLMRKKIEFFHPRYNKINYYENIEDKDDETKWYPWVTETLKLSEKNNHFYTKEDLVEADNDPVIIHYSWEKQLNKVVKKYEEDKTFYAKLVEISLNI